ncbi:carboxypeptidase-like regulatory domain-containing protein [Nocardioides massiliensis]|uniref:Alpha-amylase n=1 Tax=Nocardioides massiliensis TaxID=1325935 RepID=A0ABT9NJ59_9ACTN|nr:carboxypeptidase-like regulatory domain-containing protein [Nocardioides massiliensis]MDP9820451.1 hypothetical protein [Nocardioides massiliensis]
MTRGSRARLAVVPAVLLALVATLLVAGTATTQAAPAGKITGQIRAAGSGQGVSKLQVSLFDRHWNFIRKRKANSSGIYSFGPMRPGVYWIQVNDRRPNYDVSKVATTQAKVRVRGGRTTIRHIRVRRGAAITGTVRAGGRAAPHARVVAINQHGGTYEVRANERGEFALGGLSAASYSVFGYDRAKQFTGASTWVPKLEPGRIVNTTVRLDTRAGGLVVDLYAGREPLRARVWVTAVNRRTGQYWVARSNRGQVTLAGLHPGRYRISVPGAGNFLSRTGNVGKVHEGKFRFTSFRLNRRGGWFTGTALDASNGTGLKGVTVSVYDSAGSLRAQRKTDSQGDFRVGGSFGNEKQLTVVLEVPSGVKGQKYRKVTISGIRSVAGRGISLGEILMTRNGKF